MTDFSNFSGVYAAAITPLDAEFNPALEDLPTFLSFLARRGCGGALLLGTTGEGVSFAPEERLKIMRAALAVRQEHRNFRLLAGTGTPSLQETVELTRAAYDAGLDGVVVLPPYYYRKVHDDGLFAWFSLLLEKAVPAGAALFGYHIPGVSGIALSLELLDRLKSKFPDRFAGVKDSSGDADFARQLGERFGKDLIVLTGSDRLLSHSLAHQAAGCITALANFSSPLLRQIWDAHQAGTAAENAQQRLTALRQVMDAYSPAPPSHKAVLARRFGFPHWAVRPPLLSLSPEQTAEMIGALDKAGAFL